MQRPFSSCFWAQSYMQYCNKSSQSWICTIILPITSISSSYLLSRDYLIHVHNLMSNSVSGTQLNKCLLNLADFKFNSTKFFLFQFNKHLLTVHYMPDIMHPEQKEIPYKIVCRILAEYNSSSSSTTTNNSEKGKGIKDIFPKKT